jgi:hypothetical protein
VTDATSIAMSGETDPYRHETQEELCPLCAHEWTRHDLQDGCCDAPGFGVLGPCPCGRNRLWMAGRIAHIASLKLAKHDRPESESAG